MTPNLPPSPERDAMNQPANCMKVAAAAVATLTTVACGSYDESSGLIDLGGRTGLTTVRVNELMAANSSTAADDFGESDDWIELYNPSRKEASLGGYFISDGAESPYEWELPQRVVVPAKGFLVLWADGDPEQGDLHLGFRLSSSGEGVWITGPDGTSIDAVTFGVAPSANASYSRYPDGADIRDDGTWEWCSNPTPGESNGEACDQ